MKKMLLSLLACIGMSVNATTIPQDFSVLTRFVTGGPTTVCRAVMAAYAKEYGGNVNVIPKPGANGIIAMNELLSSNQFIVLCATLSELVTNMYEYPEHARAVTELQPVVFVAQNIISIVTRPDSKYNSLPEMLKDSRPITVGMASTTHGFILKKILRDHPFTIIPYNQPSQALPSLLDGSLDLYVSGGVFEELIDSGKLKSLGHMHGLQNSSGIKLESHYPEAAKYPTINALVVSKKVPPEVVQEFNRRINNIMKSPDVQRVLIDVRSTYSPNTVKQAEEYINRVRIEFGKNR